MLRPAMRAVDMRAMGNFAEKMGRMWRNFDNSRKGSRKVESSYSSLNFKYGTRRSNVLRRSLKCWQSITEGKKIGEINPAGYIWLGGMSPLNERVHERPK